MSGLLSLRNERPLPYQQLRWLIHPWNGLYLACLILTLGTILWNTPTWGLREVGLIVLVLLQIVLYFTFFAVTFHFSRPLSRFWSIGYFVVSFGLWLIQWQLESSFWWIIWVQVTLLYILLPLKAAIPGTFLIFLVIAHFNNGLPQFFSLPVGQIIEQVIRWIIFSTVLTFVSLLLRVNRERARLIAQLQTARQEIELAHQQEVELAALRERERLAREMHDSLGHNLVALSVQLEAIQRLYPVDPERASKQIDEMKTLARTSMEALRRTLTGLRLPGLEDRSLLQALRDLSAETSQRAGIEVICRVSPEMDQVNSVVAETLWRVTQEALLNVEKHAAAHHVQIDLHKTPTTIHLSIADDGIGLPLDCVDRPGHYGLRGMRERIEGLGGILTWDNNGQVGAVIKASLPLIGNNDC